jgi:hypothetical protein
LNAITPSPLAPEIDWPAVGSRLRGVIAARFDGNASNLTRAAGVPRNSVYPLLDGVQSNLFLGTAVKLAAACDVSLDWLFLGRGDDHCTPRAHAEGESVDLVLRFPVATAGRLVPLLRAAAEELADKAAVAGRQPLDDPSENGARS